MLGKGGGQKGEGGGERVGKRWKGARMRRGYWSDLSCWEGGVGGGRVYIEGRWDGGKVGRWEGGKVGRWEGGKVG